MTKEQKDELASAEKALAWLEVSLLAWRWVGAVQMDACGVVEGSAAGLAGGGLPVCIGGWLPAWAEVVGKGSAALRRGCQLRASAEKALAWLEVGCQSSYS